MRDRGEEVEVLGGECRDGRPEGERLYS